MLIWHIHILKKQTRNRLGYKEIHKQENLNTFYIFVLYILVKKYKGLKFMKFYEDYIS